MIAVAAVAVTASCSTGSALRDGSGASVTSATPASSATPVATFPSPQPPQRTTSQTRTAAAGSLAGQFTSWSAGLAGTVAVSVAAVGGDSTVTVAPAQRGEVAWSTIKVPVALAVVRAGASHSADVTAALTESDNAAAEALWASLGPPATAARAVDAVLADGADTTTTVQQNRVRAEFTAFGQTVWSNDSQARFAAHLPCLDQAEPILEHMRNVVAGQRWGAGEIPGAAIKGGWGPDESGAYLVRQFAIVPHRTGQTAIAISAHPRKGTFDAGVELVSATARWLAARIDRLPAGSCR